MTVVKHPTLEGVEYDVPDAKVGEWVALGWIGPSALLSATPNDVPVDDRPKPPKKPRAKKK